MSGVDGGGPNSNRKATDLEAIQGLWRLSSIVMKGTPVSGGFLHLLFKDNRYKELSPNRVDDGHWGTVELDPAAQPKRFTRLFFADDGTVRHTERWVYAIDGDELRLSHPNVYGHDYPHVLSDQEYSVSTYVRDHGPLPKTKMPAGKVPIAHRELGQLIWNDNIDWWDGQIELQPGLNVRFSITPQSGDDATAIAAAVTLVSWVRDNEAAARRYAATSDGLLAIHNQAWNDGPEISATEFASRLKLESISIAEAGTATLWFEDGGLFLGHTISVEVGKDRMFHNANIQG